MIIKLHLRNEYGEVAEEPFNTLDVPIVPNAHDRLTIDGVQYQVLYREFNTDVSGNDIRLVLQ